MDHLAGCPATSAGWAMGGHLQASPLPEGFETRLLIKEVKGALAMLPRVGYSCERRATTAASASRRGRSRKDHLRPC